jgi:hypothetical protein
MAHDHMIDFAKQFLSEPKSRTERVKKPRRLVRRAVISAGERRRSMPCLSRHPENSNNFLSYIITWRTAIFNRTLLKRAKYLFHQITATCQWNWTNTFFFGSNHLEQAINGFIGYITANISQVLPPSIDTIGPACPTIFYKPSSRLQHLLPV